MRGVALPEVMTIIPVVLALLIFFSSMVTALNKVTEKNKKTELTLTLVWIVDRLTESGVLSDERWDEIEELLKDNTTSNFFVCLSEVEGGSCLRTMGKGVDATNIGGVVGKIKGDYVTATFPVSYQINKGGVPFNDVKKITVIVWQGA